MSQETVGGNKAFRAGEALGAFVRVKLATGTGDTVVAAGAGEEFIGVTAAAAALGEMITVALRTAGRTYKMIAAGAISAGAVIYGAASGKVQAAASGNAQGLALEESTQDGEIIECALNNGAAGEIDGAAIGVEAEGGNGSVPVIFSKTGITDATTSPTIVTAPFKFRIINWWLVSRDTTAANVKLINKTTDATSVKAKGATNDAIVAGGDIVAAQRDVAAGDALKVNASAAAAFDVFVMAVKVS